MNPLRFALLTLLLTSLAGQATEVGDPAPPLLVKEWAKGEPVEIKGGTGKVYVVDFWATWSPICRNSIPLLTELQQQFKQQGVVVVGIADEAPQSIKPMVEEMGDKMMYAVGIDDQHQTTAGYLRTYGVGGIPHTFIVDQQGKVVWHGHPLSELRSVLIQVLSKTFNPAQARINSELERQVVRYLHLAAEEKPNLTLHDLGTTILKDGVGQPELLNHLAWLILTTAKTKDLDLAKNAAKTAYDATQGKEPAIADTYARALMAKDEVEAAVKIQEQAVAAAAKGAQKEQMESTLAVYRKKLPATEKPKSP